MADRVLRRPVPNGVAITSVLPAAKFTTKPVAAKQDWARRVAAAQALSRSSQRSEATSRMTSSCQQALDGPGPSATRAWEDTARGHSRCKAVLAQKGIEALQRGSQNQGEEDVS